jgi:hypothetical protein
MPAVVEAALLELRRSRSYWGPRRLVHELAKRGVQPVPSASAAYRALVRAGMVDSTARDKRSRKWKRWERSRPLELWQMDTVGGFPLAEGCNAKALTGIDDHSRVCVSAGLMHTERTRAVCDALAGALQAWGVPAQILTDIQSWWRGIRADLSAGGEDRCRPAPARQRYLTEWSALRLLAC